MKDRVQHIERPSLPWRPEHMTECGKDVAQFALGYVLTRDEAVAKVRDQGRQRAAMSTCMTCWSTASRHATWEQDPAAMVNRYVAPTWGQPSDRSQLMNRELRAIAVLVEAHREEFDDFVAGLAESGDLAAKRAERRLRRA